MTTESTTRPRQPRTPADLERMAPEPGEAAFLDGDPYRLYAVVGVLPGDDLEVVSFAQARDRSTVTAGNSLADAVADGRLVSRSCDADRLSPAPGELADEIALEEVRR